MKVLHINSNYDRTTLHQAMMNELDKLCENHVFVPTYDKYCGVIEVGSNVVVSECFKKNDRFLFYYKQRKIISEAERIFPIKQFDLIHAYTLFTDGNVAYELHKRYGIPYVVAVRSTDVKAFLCTDRTCVDEVLRSCVMLLRYFFFLSPIEMRL